MERIVSLVIGYFIGMILQTGYWLGKFNHIDIRNYGSGNAGTTNISRTLGKKAGIITYLCDALKSTLAALIIHLIFGNSTDTSELLLILYSGLGVVLGHNFPFYLGFKGGKGIAATSGVIFTMIFFIRFGWTFVIVSILLFGLIAVVTKYVSLGSLIFTAVFLIQFIIYGQIGLIPLTGFQLIESYCIIGVIVALAYIRHRGNIVRLLNGTERKIGQRIELNQKN